MALPDIMNIATGEIQKDQIRKEPVLKRSLDIALSLVGLIVSLPIWLLIGLAILVEDGRPIFFRQKRLGRYGRIFYVYKFRSMIKDAEDSTGPVWANKTDHRETKIGRFLRRTGLDELPQLYNIIVGDMSFVGPRPERPELAREFKKAIPNFDDRLYVRPGLTGLAKVHGNYNTTPKNKLRYDILYILNQSLWLDIKLILISVWLTITFKWDSEERKIDKLIGQIILESGIIKKDQLDEALNYQKSWGGKVGEILIEKSYITEEKLKHYLNLQMAMNTVSVVKGRNGNGDYLIGEVMMASGVITGKQLSEALGYQKQRGGKLGSILLSMGYISEEILKQCIAKQHEIREVQYKEAS